MDEYLYIIVRAEQLLNPPSPTLPKGEREELERLSTTNHRLEIIRCTYWPRVVAGFYSIDGVIDRGLTCLATRYIVVH